MLGLYCGLIAMGGSTIANKLPQEPLYRLQAIEHL
jgi:hypothetical protein